MENKLKVFESKQIRTLWNAEEEEWYFSVSLFLRRTILIIM